MLVGPWKGTVGGVTTFMKNVVRSPLAARYAFLPFNTSRPPKKGVTDNYGYGAIWRGGIRRLLVGGMVTLAHAAMFPFWLLIRRPDVVQVQSSDFQTFWEAAYYVWICKALRFPVAERLGGAFDNFYSASSPRARALIRRALQWPDRLIVQSVYWRDLMRTLGRSDGVHILPNWVPDALTAPVTRPDRHCPVCLFSAGSEAVRKGIDDILDAARLLKDSGVAVRLHIVAANAELERRANAAGLSDIVTLENYVGRERMLELLRASDIFLLPSRAEGFPNALVEAMATGIAAVVTPVGSIPEIVEGEAALVVPVGDATALAQSIARLCADAVLRRRTGETARQRVQRCYTEAAALPLLEEVWQALR